jgi:two-component system invasion response regulator UvrY
MIGGGQTVSEIAATLKRSVTIISAYRTRVLEKTHIRTNADLTRHAVEQKLAA